ncbi:hypothetical protein EsVE80_14010 [Enterococcus saigonensis]|uniref:Uncharacterized protein n=1 Tax=Enterococcus saigonensis TaxID=1805431 RepID=A0A679I8G9_9ENTE|nr:hypothetical protein [Enterococcus saigonensis]BCA85878.1 hypothetical protein EsVE80_14010 [Enterococcus saigonensis]
MMNLKGTVHQIKILKISDQPLVYFQLNDFHCLIATHALNFLADVAIGSTIRIAGYYNSRKQFIVKKYSLLGKSQIVIAFENSLYPPKHI